MAIPILVLPVLRDSEKSVKLAQKEQQLGDGYKQTMNLGVTPQKLRWSIKSKPLTTTEYNSVESQLRTFSGIQPFRWSPDNNATIPYEAFFCEQWEWIPLGPNAWQLNAEFVRDFEAPCEAFADFINTSTIYPQITAAVDWLLTYTRDTLPLVANAQGTTVNAFHDVIGRGGYFPASSGTSEGQAVLIRALMLSYFYGGLTNTKRTEVLNLALLYTNALLSYFYGADVPANPTAQIWLPHWLVNSKYSFQTKGLVATKFINNGHFGVVVAFTAGVGNIPTGSPNQGEHLAELQRVYSTDGQLLWQNIYSPLVRGTDYPISYWVTHRGNPGGQRFRVYPSSLSNAGANPVATNESAGKIVLTGNFTGNAICVYTSYSGVTINKNVGFEAFPAWRALDPGEKNHATDASQWLSDCYQLLATATGDSKWTRAYQANIHSTIATSQVLNASFLFKKDTTTTEPFSYPGTQLIVYNNENSGLATATRLGDGWVQATIVDGVTAFPGAELQNFAVAIQMQTLVTLDFEVEASVTTILELYISTSKNAFNFAENYTFWIPVVANTRYADSLKADEFIRFNTGTIWHPMIADSPVYSYSGGGAGNSVTLTREIRTINTFKRMTQRIALNQTTGGFAGAGLVFFNPGNRPPTIYYSKSGPGAVRLKVIDGASREYFWNLGDTAGGFQQFTPTWANADIKPTGNPSDLAITSIEIVPPPNTNSTSVVSLWYAGDPPDILPYPTVCFKTSVVSKFDGNHTFKVGDIEAKNSPLNNLLGNPGVLPFTVNMINGVTDSWRGAPNVGYQSPRIYAAQYWNYPDRAQQVLDFFLSSQNAYAAQNLNGTDGFFVTSYVWPVWSAGVGQAFNTWSFTESVDPSFDWEGYQFRPIVECAKYWMSNKTDRKAATITMRFLGGLDRLQRKNNESRCPTNFPAQIDPQFNYVSVHATALAIRAALYANIAGGSPTITFRLLKRNLDFLATEYVSTGNMAGTWAKSQNDFVVGGQTYKEWFGFWMGEVIETLNEVVRLKEQIIYPPCSVSL